MWAALGIITLGLCMLIMVGVIFTSQSELVQLGAAFIILVAYFVMVDEIMKRPTVVTVGESQASLSTWLAWEWAGRSL